MFDLPSRIQPNLIYTALHWAMQEELKKAGFLASVYEGESDYSPQTLGGKVQNCFTNPVADHPSMGKGSCGLDVVLKYRGLR